MLLTVLTPCTLVGLHVILFLTLVVMVPNCIFEPFQEKAHYEGVMEKHVLAPITTTESELTGLQQLHQVIALLLAIILCSNPLFFMFNYIAPSKYYTFI